MMGKSYWIWYYGDYELYHIMKANLRREERGYKRPIFWKQVVPYVNVKFQKTVDSDGGTFKAYFNCSGYIAVNGKRYNEGIEIKVPKGKCKVEALISKENGFPAIFIESDVCPSDETWECNYCAGKFIPAGYNEYFDEAQKNPEIFPFAYENKVPVNKRHINNGILYDFGTELFGYLNIVNADAKEKINIFYGESEEEAIDTEHSLIIDSVEGSKEYQLKQRALRYVFIETECKNIDVSVDYEYLPLEKKGWFKCDNELFNKIYDVAAYTFHLNCREGFLDGIKRDRWVWAGDAYQSASINTYLFQDKAIEQRTAIGLIGKKPVEQNINYILDYSLLWIIGLYEHYMVYGDVKFLSRIYEMATEMIAFSETRINSDGFIEGTEDDWTFIDWAEIDMTGAVCAEKMLLIAAYKAMGNISKVLGKKEEDAFFEKSEVLKKLVNQYYWNEVLGAFIDSYTSGKNNVTRHANIFAIMYDIAEEEKKRNIIKNVLENDSVPQITTPYFKGYELDVMSKVNGLDKVEFILDSYWGEMIRCGCKTIWEEFKPEETGIERYGMYDGKYEKSLCHAWGAGPVYIFGRYYLGVYPTAPGFETFNVEPNLGGLNEIEGVVPVGDGVVKVSLNHNRLKVKASKSGGTLIWKGKHYKIEPDVELVIDC